MNTNSNVYTVIYTTVIVIVVAALLAFVSGKLGPAQDANAKAETLRQMTASAVETTSVKAALTMTGTSSSSRYHTRITNSVMRNRAAVSSNSCLA